MTVGAKIRMVCQYDGPHHCANSNCWPGGDSDKPLIPSSLTYTHLGDYHLAMHTHCNSGNCLATYELNLVPGFNQVCCPGTWSGAFMTNLP